MSLRVRVCTLLSLGLALAGRAQVAAPAGGEAMLPAEGVAGFRLTATGPSAGAGKLSVVAATSRSFARALRIETTRDTGPVWTMEVRAPLTRAAAAGDSALIHFFARTIEASDETGGGQLRVAIQKNDPAAPYTADTQFTLGREWQELFVPFRFAGDLATGEATIVFGVGYKRQTIEVGGCEVWHYGARVAVGSLPRTRFTYAGREPDAAWRREAQARIAKIRQADFVITVVNAAGQPVPGAIVRVEQRRAAFQFGTALQFERLVRDSPDNLRYREKTLELFNAASPENDLKWPVWLGEWGRDFSREQSLTALRWLRAHQFHTRGHVLVWPSWRNLPKAIGALRGTPEQAGIPSRILAHIAEMTASTRDLLDEWDVLNEPWDNHDLMDLFGQDIMADWFAAARAALPTQPLYLNDYSNHDAITDGPHVEHFEATTRFLLGRKAPLTGLGLQAHIGSTPNAPVRVLAVLDRYAKFGLPIRVTEFDINSDDEELQADYTRDFLTLMFSHPSVVGVQFWGFWEQAHWRPRSAMYRADWSEKPNAKAYRALVLDQWRTRLDGKTGADGRYAARGFHGDYVVTAEAGGRKTEKAFSLAAGRAAGLEITVP